MYTRQLKKRVSISCSLMVAAVLLVGILYSMSERRHKVKNGFSRYFLTAQVEVINSVKRNKKIYDVTGHTANNFYYQTEDPGILAISSKTLDSFRYVNINIIDKAKIGASFSCDVRYPYYYIYAGNMRCVITVDLEGKTATQYYNTGNLFTRAAKLSPTAFLFRGIDTSFARADQVFIKQDAFSKVKSIKSFTKRNDDAGFSTDGLLHYDTAGGRLLYIHSFSNQLICFDTTLHIVYRANTIDTISSVGAAETFAAGTGKMVSFSRPMPMINAANCIDGGFIYNYSTLQADNENDSTFERNSAIDIYSITNGQYAGSFNIPAFNKEKIKFFKVYGNTLVALYENYIVLYRRRAL